MVPAVGFVIVHRHCNRWRGSPSSFDYTGTIGKPKDVASYVLVEVLRLPSFLGEDAFRELAYLVHKHQEVPYHELACAYLADTCKERKGITSTWPQLPLIVNPTSAYPQKHS